MRFVSQAYLLSILRDIGIIRLENRDEFIDEGFPFLIDDSTGCSHHLLPYRHQFLLGFNIRFQQGIPLHQRLVITNKRLQVFAVELRNHDIHKTTAFFTPAGYQQRISRRYQNQRNESDMVGQTGILLLIPLKLFLLFPFQPTIHLFGFLCISFIKSLNNKKVLIMTDVLRVNRIRRTFAE